MVALLKTFSLAPGIEDWQRSQALFSTTGERRSGIIIKTKILSRNELVHFNMQTCKKRRYYYKLTFCLGKKSIRNAHLWQKNTWNQYKTPKICTGRKPLSQIYSHSLRVFVSLSWRHLFGKVLFLSYFRVLFSSFSSFFWGPLLFFFIFF